MVLKFPCYLIHYLHRNLFFHFGRMYRSHNQNCYCNLKIYHFGRMLWSWNYKYCHWPPHAWIQFSYDVKLPQVCLHHCETLLLWNWYLSLIQRILLFGRMYWSQELQYFCLLYCLFYFGRVFVCWNEQCFLWWCCHSFELGISKMVLLGGSLQYDGIL